MNLFQHYFHKNKTNIVLVLMIIFYFVFGFPTNAGGPWHFENHLGHSDISVMVENILTFGLATIAVLLLYIPYQTWKRTKE